MVEFQTLNHTADIGIKAYGETLEKLFCNTAIAMFSIITDLDKIKPLKKFNIKIKGENEENLMIRWLNELLYLFETEYHIFKKFDLKIENISYNKPLEEKIYNNLLIKAVAYGEKIDLEKHTIKTHIKGATYHKLEIKRNRKFTASIFFDV